MSTKWKRSGFWVWDKGGSIDGPENWQASQSEFPGDWKPSHVPGTLQKVFPAGDMVRCNSGHETPHAIWNCPACTDEKIENLSKLVIGLKEWLERPSHSKEPITKYQIGKLLRSIGESSDYGGDK